MEPVVVPKTTPARDLLSELAALQPDGAARHPPIVVAVAKAISEPALPDRRLAMMARAEEPMAIPALEAPLAIVAPLMDGVDRPARTAERVAKPHLEVVARLSLSRPLGTAFTWSVLF